VSPESAAAAALTGKITDPRDLGMDYPSIQQPEEFFSDNSMFVPPSYTGEIYRGPTMGPPPSNSAMPQSLKAVVAIKLGDKITTDHIIPAGSVSRYRSNIQKSSEFVFKNIDPDFTRTCETVKAKGLSSIIVAGVSYGQGSSREHAAICPMVLGVRAVIAKSIERIHMANLINFGIMPLSFKNIEDYDNIQYEDELEIPDIYHLLRQSEFVVICPKKQNSFPVHHHLTSRQVEIVLHGGLLNYTGKK
jgi:aconitate hydratase